MARLFLIDGMSHIYRAYYAIKGLTNDQGLSTNAVYGFAAMLRKLIKEEKPEFLAVAFDLFGPTVRHAQYAEYKATRPKMPKDLAEQIPLIRELCEAFRIPVLSHEGYEADDVIGSMSELAVKQGLDVVIVSIDKDMYQLVNSKVTVLDTRNMTNLDPEGVKEKWGVHPEKVVDVLALVGDTSDNVPGAPGIGEKGARNLIAEFGGLDQLLARKDEVKRKSYRESLQKNEDLIRQSRQLIKIHRDLPLEFNTEELRVQEADQERVRDLFTSLGFKSLAKEFLPPPPAEPELEVVTVKTWTELSRCLRDSSDKWKGVALWVNSEQSLEGLAIACSPAQVIFLDREFLHAELCGVAGLFAGADRWVFHDLKPFWLYAIREGWETSDSSVSDTMLMAYLLRPNNRDFSLKEISSEYLGIQMSQGSQQQYSLLEGSSPKALGEAAGACLKLHAKLGSMIRDQGLERLLTEVEVPLVRVLADMENRGVKVDTEQLAAMAKEVSEEIDRLATQIFAAAGEEFNLNSPRQLSEILFEKMQLPSRRKTGKAGHYSTGVEVLEKLAVDFEIARLLLDYRELAKLKNTYLDALPKLVKPETGRIHTSYNQTVASTGRLSSSNPNLQNIPIRSELGRKIRRAFVPANGFQIVAADYSQIELRVMAHLSGDPVLTEAFKHGEDIHDRTAKEVFGDDSGLDRKELRRRAKVINFGIMYGLSAFGLGKSLKISRAEAQKFIDEYFERYRGVREWTEATLKSVQELGYVTTLFGRIRQIPEINSKNWTIREFARRTAINAPIQGTAADLIKMAMVSIYHRIREEKLDSRLILQVHDELVFEAERSEVEYLSKIVKVEMEGVAELDIPLKVELAAGGSWYEAK